MSYVTSSGGQFLLDGRRFRFVGANCYPLVQDNIGTDNLDNFFKYCVRDGIKVIRTWCFNKTVPATNTVGNFRYLSGGRLNWVESTFVSLDRVLASASKYGVRITLPLVDNNSNNKEDYLTWNDTINGTSYGTNEWEFFDDANVRQMYKDFVDKLAARVNTINGRAYATDDTIFSIELGNELRYDKGGDPDINTPASFNFAQLGKAGGWADVMSTYIRTKFPNHLIGYGDIAHTNDYVAGDAVHNGTFYGVDYTLTGALTNISYFDFHVYPYTDSPGFVLNDYGIKSNYSLNNAFGLVAQINEFTKIAKTAGKPVIIGEWGVDKRNTLNDKYTSYPRAEHYRKLFRDFYSRDGDGIFLWHYSTSNILDDNNYNIKPDGVHTGANANSNENDNDSSLLLLLRETASYIRSTRKPVSS